MNRENHLLEIHPLVILTKETVKVLWPLKLENVKAYRGGNNISEVKCRDPTDWPFHLEVTRMIPFIEPSLVGFA